MTKEETLYIDLIKNCILGFIHEDIPLATFRGMIQEEIDVNPKQFIRTLREQGEDWPSQAHSMIGLKRMNNLQFCIEDVIKNGIPGDFIECGVWRGGACIFMRAMLKAHNSRRNVWVADSFKGLPISANPIDETMRPLAVFGNSVLAVSADEVRENFKRYGLLDNQVQFIEGWFCDTLPDAPIELAILRIDGDLYESTRDALVLYDRLSPGGYCIIDDYVIPSCATAVHEFFRSQHITDPIIQIDTTGAFWRKTG